MLLNTFQSGGFVCGESKANLICAAVNRQPANNQQTHKHSLPRKGIVEDKHSSQYLPLSSSLAGWGIVCWLIYCLAPQPGSVWYKSLDSPDWSIGKGQDSLWRRPLLCPGQRGAATKAAGPIGGGGRGWKGRSPWWCAWQLGHDPARLSKGAGKFREWDSGNLREVRRSKVLL